MNRVKFTGGKSKTRAIPVPDRKEVDRIKSEVLRELEKREYIILGIALLAACEYGKYGKKKSNELVDMLLKIRKTHEDYDDTEYSFRTIKDELIKHGVDAETLFELSRDFKSSVQDAKLQKKDTQLKGTEYLKVRKQMEEIRLVHKSYREELLKK